MLNITKTFVIATAMMCSFSAWACDKPNPPEIPDAKTAVTPQMVKAKNDVQAYMAAAQAYLDCGLAKKKHNDMVDEMNGIADKFNAAVRDFKSRMAG